MQLMPAVVCLTRQFGIKGMLIYAKLKLGMTDGISVPEVVHPIYLRKNTSDIPTFQEIFTYKEYDVTLDYYPQTIVDAGANVGLASVYFANRYPKARIICIEPEKTNFTLLQKNTKSYKNIFPLKNALSNQSKQTINIIDEGGGNWAFRTESVESSKGKKIDDFAETITVSDIMKQNGLEYIDVLKIDIEGAERQVFESGYDQWLPKTRCLIIELHDRFAPGSSKAVFKALSEYNFSYSQNGENLIFVNMDAKLQATQTPLQ